MSRIGPTLILSHCPPAPPWSGERRLVAAAESFFRSISDVDFQLVDRTDEPRTRVANKLRTPLAPPYAARFSTPFDEWELYDTIWVYEVWAMSCVPPAIAHRVLWDKDTLMGDSFLQQSDSRARALAAHWIRWYERTVLRRVRWAFLSNPDEILNLGLPRVSFLPHGIDRAIPRRPGWTSTDRLTLGFTGVLGYGPNRNGLVDFLQREYARVRAAGAALGRGVELLIAGSQLSPADAELVASFPEVSLLGYVDDIGDFYRRVDIALAPMTQGAGSPTKVMEALAHGVPVVGTPTGLRGLDPRLTAWTVTMGASHPWGDILASASNLVECQRGGLHSLLQDFESGHVFERVVGPVIGR